MNWFPGTIDEAIRRCGELQAVFVVYIEDATAPGRLNELVNDSRISAKLETENFVAIRLMSDTQYYRQFAAIYQMVPVPSLFFIWRGGAPIEVVSNATTSVQELDEKIENVLKVAGKVSTTVKTTPTPIPAPTQTPTPTPTPAPAATPAVIPAATPPATNIPIANNAGDSSFLTAVEQTATAGVQIPTIGSDHNIRNNSKVPPNSPTDSESDESGTAAAGQNKYENVGKKTKRDKTKAADATNNVAVKEKSVDSSEKSVVASIQEGAKTLNDTKHNNPGKLSEKITVSTGATPVVPSNDESAIAGPSKNSAKSKKPVDDEKKAAPAASTAAAAQPNKNEQVPQSSVPTIGDAADPNDELLLREQAIKELKENLRRERLAEQHARERIRAQIAADRAEQVLRFKRTDGIESQASAAAAPDNVSNEDMMHQARLQFRLANAQNVLKAFDPTDTLATVRRFVADELLINVRNKDFTLALMYPRREFNTDEDEKTLTDLGLVPTAVILIILHETPNVLVPRVGFLNLLQTIFIALTAPLRSLWDYLKPRTGRVAPAHANLDGPNTSNVATQKKNDDFLQQLRENSTKRFDNDAAGTAASTAKGHRTGTKSTKNKDAADKPYRRFGGSNIHRITDNRDSDDENATWNGNSTQQQ